MTLIVLSSNFNQKYHDFVRELDVSPTFTEDTSAYMPENPESRPFLILLDLTEYLREYNNKFGGNDTNFTGMLHDSTEQLLLDLHKIQARHEGITGNSGGSRSVSVLSRSDRYRIFSAIAKLNLQYCKYSWELDIIMASLIDESLKLPTLAPSRERQRELVDWVSYVLGFAVVAKKKKSFFDFLGF